MSFFEVLDLLTITNGKLDHEQASKFKFSAEFAQKHVLTKLSSLPLRSGIDICKGELSKKLVDFALSTWSPESVTEYAKSVLSLLETRPAELNSDDTDIIQHSLAAFRKMIEIDSSLVALIVPEAKVAKQLMEVLLSILTTHKKMVNLIQYMVDILSVYFDGTSRKVTDEERKLFTSIIDVGFSQNRENSDIMKELIRVAPRFCSE